MGVFSVTHPGTAKGLPVAVSLYKKHGCLSGSRKYGFRINGVSEPTYVVGYLLAGLLESR